MKKLILLIMLMSLSIICYAETCPNVDDIKNNQLKGWKAYDSEDGKVLSTKRSQQYSKLVEKFALAEWSTQKNKTGAIHCYYLDKSGSNLEAYLAKNHFEPVNNQHYWYQVSGYTQCAAGKEQCIFKHQLAAQRQLARG